MKKFLWFLAEHAFALILFFLVLDMAIGVAVFYKYSLIDINFSSQNASIFKYDLYNQIINDWQSKDLSSPDNVIK